MRRGYWPVRAAPEQTCCRPAQADDAADRTPDRAAAVSPYGRVVVFTLPIRRRGAEAAAARDTLEEQSWLPPDADAAGTRKIFECSSNRIAAVASLKLLARPVEALG